MLANLNPDGRPLFVSVYLDGILIFSESFEDNLSHLQAVITRLSQSGLKLEPSKCHFIQRQVEYRGRLITPQGISPNPARTQAVSNFPIPKSVKDVRQFVGLASYFCHFIANLAKIARPLHALTSKGAVFKWTDQCQNAFNELKDHLTSAHILSYPNFSKLFSLETNANS